MKIFRKRKGLRIRLAALLMAFLICFSSFAVCEMKAEASATIAFEALAGLALSLAGNGLKMDGENILSDQALGMAAAEAVAFMFMEYFHLDVYVSERALQEGKKPTDFLAEKMTEFFDSIGKSVNDGLIWLLDGCVWLYDGSCQLNKVVSERWKEFFEYIFGVERIYNSIDEIPNIEYVCGDMSFYHVSEVVACKDGYNKRYDKVVFNHNTIFLPVAYEDYFVYLMPFYFESDFELLNENSVLVVKYEQLNIDNPYKFEIRKSEFEYDYYNPGFCFAFRDSCFGFYKDYNKNLQYEYFRPYGDYPYINDSFCNAIRKYIIDNIGELQYVGINSVLIGSIEEVNENNIYNELDAISEDQSITLNPGIIDGTLSDQEDAIPINIDDYLALILAILNGLGSISLPGIGDISIPDTLDVEAGIGEKTEEGIKVIEDADTDEKEKELVAAVDIPAVADPVEDILNWGLGYISPATGILSKFPFSIPYDLYMIVNALSGEAAVDAINADPKELTINNDLAPPGTTYEASNTSALSWHFTFTIPYGNTQTVVPLDIDLSDYEWVFRIIRYFTGILWLVGLLSWTRKESS